jgi:hypothetical protein
VKAHVDNSDDDHQIRTASFVYELILLREHDLVLSNNVDLSRDELDQSINVVCTQCFIQAFAPGGGGAGWGLGRGG